MALSAVLEFGNNDIQRYSKRYLLVDSRFVCDRPYSDFSPKGAARCERVEVTVVAPGKEDLSLFEWFSNQSVQSGRIVISLSTDGSLDTDDTQVLYFEEAKCFSLSEVYDIDNSRRRQLRLAIGAEQISIDDITFNRI